MITWKRNLWILWTTQIISMISFGLGLPFLSYYIQDLGITQEAQIKAYTAILSAAPAITMAIMAPIWGALADRYGKKLMILRAMFAAVFVIGLMGFATAGWQLVILRFAQGLFTGTITAATAFIASNTPNEHLSHALGIMSSSTFIGFSAGPLVGGIIADQFGYRISFFAGAVLMFIGGCLVFFLLKEVMSVKDKHREPYNFFKAIKTFSPLILSLLLVLFLQRVTRSIFSPYLALYVGEMLKATSSLSPAFVTGLLSASVGFATALAGLTISKLGDRYDKLKIIRVLLVIALPLSLPVALSNSLLGFAITYTILFFILGGIEPILVSKTAGLTPSDQRGFLFGVQGLIGSLGWMVSPVVGGYISINYSIKSLLWILPLAISINLLVSFVIFFTKRKTRV